METILNHPPISSSRSDHRAFNTSKKGKEKTEKEEKMIVMKCQRLRPDKTFEEIEIELPVDIFNRVVQPNTKHNKIDNNKTLTQKIRNIFIR